MHFCVKEWIDAKAFLRYNLTSECMEGPVMRTQIKEELCMSAAEFRLPRYNDLPDHGLYLEQTARYISELLAPVQDAAVTGSMISNYVKKDLVDNPVKKQYFRDQIAYLIFISAAKTVLSMEDIGLLVKIQKQTYDNKKAYDYFCSELENVIYYVFGVRSEIENIGEDDTDEKKLLRDIIITLAHKAYLSRCFERLHREEEQ